MKVNEILREDEGLVRILRTLQTLARKAPSDLVLDKSELHNYKISFYKKSDGVGEDNPVVKVQMSLNGELKARFYSHTSQSKRFKTDEIYHEFQFDTQHQYMIDELFKAIEKALK